LPRTVVVDRYASFNREEGRRGDQKEERFEGKDDAAIFADENSGVVPPAEKDVLRSLQGNDVGIFRRAFSPENSDVPC
jgi:hypothetical protein